MHPVLFKVWPVTIYSYGLFVALGFGAVVLLVIDRRMEYGVTADKNTLWDIVFYALLSGVIGARLLHVLLNLRFYAAAPLEIFKLHKGGLAIQGGILLALLVCVPYGVKKNLPAWKTLDLIFTYVPLGQAIGRIGCYLNGCCFGKWGLPVQIYMALGLLAIFAFLRARSAKRSFDGEIFLFYFLLEAPFRFAMDFLRADLPPAAFGLTASQLIGLAVFLAALSIYYAKVRVESRI